MNAAAKPGPLKTEGVSWLESLNTPVVALAPAVDGEIEIMQRRLLELYAQQRAYLESKPTPFVEELLHRAEEQRFTGTFSSRTAAELNRAACTLILEERKR